ncbi:LPS-assembly protein [Salinihabitans flavidus]|uniref:LPS-assembly protein LptD n=1 Tax=Salinihabitans flavidus TaxID=569882 RepID=A0A1H8RQ86_9RHOB|nr:LPS assembly protein LptD [Salinihabitans flavidus]SEO68338.1 LPS-assembly protein [Salinihabitans flavidus]
MSAFRVFISLCLGLLAAPLPAGAQDMAGNVMLVADEVFLTGQNQLIARGNVEAMRGDTRLRASRITYDRARDRITLDGPVRITEGEDLILLADQAELDSDFRNGLLRSARMVMNQQLQLAAVQIDRVEGRYNVLSKTAVTSCRVCETGQPPLWQIRARRVVHDSEAKQLYLDGAQLRVLDVPVFYLPRLRLPDPTQRRATGFLIPSIRTGSQLGTGIKIPYFIALREDRDLTLTPYLSPETRTMEFRYRQAFRRGRIAFEGALSDDSLSPPSPRGYLFGTGRFDLGRDYVLTFDAKMTSDDAYLLDYGYSGLDRLDSEIAIARSRRDENTRLALLHYQSLRANESNATLPTIVGAAETERRYFPSALGGEVRLGLGLHGHYRYSDLDTDSADADSVVDGRDVGRVNAEISWRRNWTLAYGLRAGVTGALALDAVRTRQDATRGDFDAQATPSMAAHLRWPLIRAGGNGVTQILEPVAQLAWTGGSRMDIANDESTRVELDEGNLLSLSRFPSVDRRERGLVGTWGVNWSRLDPDGWTAHLSLGQVIRETADTEFSRSSGLSGARSDLLVAGQIKTQNGLSLTARGLFDGFDDMNKAEARAGWRNSNLTLDAAYVWLGADPAEDRARTLSEWTLDSRYRFSRHWSGLFNWRYDIASDSTAEAGIGVEYRNECVQIDLSVSRRFTSSTTLEPSTDIGLTIALLGFSVRSGDKSYNRTCNKTAG